MASLSEDLVEIQTQDLEDLVVAEEVDGLSIDNLVSTVYTIRELQNGKCPNGFRKS